jgi:single stranded DNA-binding protein
MASVNKVILIGNLGRDAELRYTPGGTARTGFSVATTESFKDKEGQWQEKTEWHNVVVWGPRAESVTENLTKGKQVYIEGKISSRSVADDNLRRQIADVLARELHNDSSAASNAVERLMESIPSLSKRQFTDIRADKIFTLGPRQRAEPRGEREGFEPAEREPAREPAEVTEDDIPF